MKLKQGFTLIEVVVVIGIIGILTVIIFPAVSNVRAKNRDTERVADIAALQLGLSLYYSQKGQYPAVTVDDLVSLAPKYFPADSLVSPTNDKPYIYIPLARGSGDELKRCTYYHLGTELELPSGQINLSDRFSSVSENISNNYTYCLGLDGGPIYAGDDGLINSLGPKIMYAVHP